MLVKDFINDLLYDIEDNVVPDNARIEFNITRAKGCEPDGYYGVTYDIDENVVVVDIKI